jgi:hypothetical protein
LKSETDLYIYVPIGRHHALSICSDLAFYVSLKSDNSIRFNFEKPLLFDDKVKGKKIKRQKGGRRGDLLNIVTTRRMGLGSRKHRDCPLLPTKI